MKNITRILLSAAIITTLNNMVFADGNAFTPLDFDKTSTTNQAAQTPDTSTLDAVGNESIQNAIMQIDNAQVGLRNDLTNYKAKYADVDAQYKLIKNERAVLKKQIYTLERKIKNLEANKAKLKKSMN